MWPWSLWLDRMSTEKLEEHNQYHGNIPGNYIGDRDYTDCTATEMHIWRCNVWTGQRPSFIQAAAAWNVSGVICTTHLIIVIWFHMCPICSFYTLINRFIDFQGSLNNIKVLKQTLTHLAVIIPPVYILTIKRFLHNAQSIQMICDKIYSPKVYLKVYLKIICGFTHKEVAEALYLQINDCLMVQCVEFQI